MIQNSSDWRFMSYGQVKYQDFWLFSHFFPRSSNKHQSSPFFHTIFALLCWSIHYWIHLRFRKKNVWWKLDFCFKSTYRREPSKRNRWNSISSVESEPLAAPSRSPNMDANERRCISCCRTGKQPRSTCRQREHACRIISGSPPQKNRAE